VNVKKDFNKLGQEMRLKTAERTFFPLSNRFAKLARFLVFYEEKVLQHR